MNRRRSKMWNYFRVVNENRSMARCKFCLSVMSYRTTVSNLRKHLYKKHPDIVEHIEEAEQDNASDTGNFTSVENGSDNNQITYEIIENDADEHDTSEDVDQKDTLFVPPPVRKQKTNHENLASIIKIEPRRSGAVDRETEFDLWARSVAIQLNKMDVKRALELQFQIQSLISKERLDHETEQ
ncbi:hypothetical protein ABEB36_012023 [Hypothenemus hampei]|uniref:BED-type domain-containing protein n=1 Tax=Hypothenemus hampei TaxID=57062 RepID=A0ABD1E9W8_HYPHA